MFAAGLLTLITRLMEKPITTNFPLAQIILGFIGLCSMVSYVILRQRIVNKRGSKQQISYTAYLLPNFRQWLGGHHGATGHAGSAK